MKQNIEMKNFYSEIKKQKPVRNTGYKKTGIELPTRILVCSPSGSGKSNWVLNFLALNSGTFSKIVICVKNSDEPLYNLLREESDDVEFSEEGIIPPINDFKIHKSSCIVFDDLVLEKDQSKIGEYFIRGRKLGITCIYITQSYYRTPKIIRINCRYIIIKRLSSIKDLKLILSEYNLSTDINDVLQLYEESTKDFLSFLLIDTQNNIFNNGFLKVN